MILNFLFCFSSNPEDDTSYQFITNGCGVADEDGSLKIHQNAESTSASFSMESFMFKGGSKEIYLHCNVWHLITLLKANGF